MVEQPVQYCRGDDGVPQEFSPFSEALVGSEDYGAPRFRLLLVYGLSSRRHGRHPKQTEPDKNKCAPQCPQGYERSGRRPYGWKDMDMHP